MKTKQNFNILALLLLMGGLLCYGCSDWTDVEAERYAGTVEDSDFPDPGSDNPSEPEEPGGSGGLPEQADEAFYQRLRDYRQGSHKKFGGWFGSWSGYSGKRLSQGSLAALPYGIDFACLWLFNLEAAEAADIENLHRDAAEFHRRGGVTLMSWTARAIGDGMTPKGQDAATVFGTGNEGIKKYAQAIVDFCVKYHIDGFEDDLEGGGSLLTNRGNLNLFLKELKTRFQEAHKKNPDTCAGLVAVDIPITYLSNYNYLDEETLKMLDMIQWQTYSEIANTYSLKTDFDRIETAKPNVFDEVIKKSTLTATFERGALDKNALKAHLQNPQLYYSGDVYGYGAYHIEQDYNETKYEYVRECIELANPEMPKEFSVAFNY